MEILSTVLGKIPQRVDSIFYLILGVAAFVFVAGELFWRIRGWNASGQTPPQSKSPQDDNRFNLVWTLVPAVVLFFLAFVDAGSALQRRAQKIANGLGARPIPSGTLQASK